MEPDAPSRAAAESGRPADPKAPPVAGTKAVLGARATARAEKSAKLTLRWWRRRRRAGGVPRLPTEMQSSLPFPHRFHWNATNGQPRLRRGDRHLIWRDERIRPRV